MILDEKCTFDRFCVDTMLFWYVDPNSKSCVMSIIPTGHENGWIIQRTDMRRYCEFVFGHTAHVHAESFYPENGVAWQRPHKWSVLDLLTTVLQRVILRM